MSSERPERGSQEPTLAQRWKRMATNHPWLFAIAVVVIGEICVLVVTNIGYRIVDVNEETKDFINIGSVLLLLVLAFAFFSFLDWQHWRASKRGKIKGRR